MKELLARHAVLHRIRESPAATKDLEKANGMPLTGLPQSAEKQCNRIIAKNKIVQEQNKTTATITAKPRPEEQLAKKKRPNSSDSITPTKDRPSKYTKPSPTIVVVSAQNFLGVGAKRARENRSARRAKNVGFLRSTLDEKKSNTGSGVPFKRVIRLKYVQGFTHAVRNPCRMEDLV